MEQVHKGRVKVFSLSDNVTIREMFRDRAEGALSEIYEP